MIQMAYFSLDYHIAFLYPAPFFFDSYLFSLDINSPTYDLLLLTDWARCTVLIMY